MALRWQGFAVPKRGNRADEYEDAFAGNPKLRRFAIADGASESSFASLWAQLLVEGFTQPPRKLSSRKYWLEPLRQRWSSEVAKLQLPWYAEAKRALGASATFLGLALKRSAKKRRGIWLASVVGDCCMFQIHEDQLSKAFPLTRSEDFGNQPKLLNSLPRASDNSHQHGNVLLVPGSKPESMAIKLVDYDGMFLPALVGKPSGEVGHPAYQHPQRLREGTYGPDVDRFSLLVTYCAIRSLMAGGRPLWDRYDNGDNLLFREQDLRGPRESALFGELARLNDPEVRRLADCLRRATYKPLDKTPLLEELVPDIPGWPSITAPKPREQLTPSAAETGGPLWTTAPPPVSVPIRRATMTPAETGEPLFTQAVADTLGEDKPEKSHGLLALPDQPGPAKEPSIQLPVEATDCPLPVSVYADDEPKPRQSAIGSLAISLTIVAGLFLVIVIVVVLNATGPKESAAVVPKPRPEEPWPTPLPEPQFAPAAAPQREAEPALPEERSPDLAPERRKLKSKPKQEEWESEARVARSTTSGQKVQYLSDMQELAVKVAEGRFAKKGDLGYNAGNPYGPRILVNGKDPLGGRILVKGKESPHGLSMHPSSDSYASAKYELGETAQTFIASVALNDSAGGPGRPPGVGKIPTPLTFQVLGDGKVLWKSKPVDSARNVQECKVDVTGIEVLELRVDCPGSYINAQAVWLEPRLQLRLFPERRGPTPGDADKEPARPKKEHPDQQTEAAAKAKARQAEAEAAKGDEDRATRLLKYAKDLLADGKTEVAKIRLEKIIEEYPDSKAAAEAKKMLKGLE